MGAALGMTNTATFPAAKFGIALAQIKIQVCAAVLPLICCFTLSVTPAFGQMNTAEIAGQVRDPSGASIAGATVLATQIATQQKYNAVTNEAGLFLLPQLPLGEYTLTVTVQGFKQAVQERVALHVGDHVRQDFQLELGEQSQTVTVEGTGGLLQVQSAEIKDVIQNQQVVDLPLKGRQFLELALLSEGVVNPPGGTRGDSLQQTGKLINIMGNRTGHNLFLVDGVNVTDEYFNNVVLNPSVDDVSEFNIAKTNYNAEFGGKSGGVINVITKSGTNNFHGSVYEFLRNNIFDAMNLFAPPGGSPPFRENQFGGAVGGPIVKDKTFFFVNYDGQRIRNSLPQLFSVPTAAERSGDLSGLVPVPTATPNPKARQLVDPIIIQRLRRHWLFLPSYRRRPQRETATTCWRLGSKGSTRINTMHEWITNSLTKIAYLPALRFLMQTSLIPSVPAP